ncbi:calcium-activated chloride channel regulator 2 [Trichonephila clavipes]|nr:calcium-activated chloride channel regulator 2 [Trichonephila clavipes]
MSSDGVKWYLEFWRAPKPNQHCTLLEIFNMLHSHTSWTLSIFCITKINQLGLGSNLQAWELLEHASQTLYTATGLRIGTVTVRLPSTWNTSALGGESITVASSELTEQKPDILVDATKDNALGKNPIALQYGGCTVSGHQIILPQEFLSSSDEYPKGKLLAREWLKYRYGVFDENGFKGDEMYPEYYQVPGSSEIRITECTSPEVSFYFKNPATGNNCSMDKPDDFNTCKIHPEEDVNVTSSLMYYHEELKEMEHICGEQNHTHKENTRSKHNTLCNGASIWDVLKKSPDFSVDGPFEEYQPVELSFIQDSSPRVALFLENSDKLYKKGRLKGPGPRPQWGSHLILSLNKITIRIISTVKCYFRLYSPKNWEFWTTVNWLQCDDCRPCTGLGLTHYTLLIQSKGDSWSSQFV